MPSSNVVCFLAAAAARGRSARTPEVQNQAPNCSMKTPENDLFEITLNLNEKPARTLVRISGQKATQFRVQLCDGVESETLVERDLTLIGTEFPHAFEATCLGNLRAWVGGHDADQVRRLLEAGGVAASSLTFARAIREMDQKGVDAEEALRLAQLTNEACRGWLLSVNQAASEARALAAGQQT